MHGMIHAQQWIPRSPYSKQSFSNFDHDDRNHIWKALFLLPSHTVFSRFVPMEASRNTQSSIELCWKGVNQPKKRNHPFRINPCYGGIKTRWEVGKRQVSVDVVVGLWSGGGWETSHSSSKLSRDYVEIWTDYGHPDSTGITRFIPLWPWFMGPETFHRPRFVKGLILGVLAVL